MNGLVVFFSPGPENGLVVFSGHVETEEKKTKKMTIDFEPIKPLAYSLYHFDSKFLTKVRYSLLTLHMFMNYPPVALIDQCATERAISQVHKALIKSATARILNQ